MVFDSSLVFCSQIRNMNNGKSFPPSSWVEIDAEEGPSWGDSNSGIAYRSGAARTCHIGRSHGCPGRLEKRILNV